MILVTISVRGWQGRTVQVISADDEADFADKMVTKLYAWRRINSVSCPGRMSRPPEFDIPITDLDFGEDATQ